MNDPGLHEPISEISRKIEGAKDEGEEDQNDEGQAFLRPRQSC